MVIMNASSLLGRVSIGFVANKLGGANIVIVSASCCAVVILGMIGLSDAASVVAIAVLYGLFSGICEFSWLFGRCSR